MDVLPACSERDGPVLLTARRGRDPLPRRPACGILVQSHPVCPLPGGLRGGTTTAPASGEGTHDRHLQPGPDSRSAQYESVDVGNEVADALDHFRGTWDDKREMLTKGMRNVGDMVQGTADGFDVFDNDMAAKVQELIEDRGMSARAARDDLHWRPDHLPEQ